MAKSRSQYITEHDEDSSGAISFSLVDEATIARRQKEGDISLPARKIDVAKDMRWNTKQMNGKLLQGILNGDPIPKIATSLLDVVKNNAASATRSARTMITQAENAGRQDSYANLASQGVIQKKVWIATPDDRTRESHLDLDGEEIDINAQFSNGLMYPGDPHGDPSEVWNCRCTMRDRIVGFRKADGTIFYVKSERGDTMHNRQMVEEATRRGVERPVKEERIIPTTAQELAEKWGIPVEGLKGDVITNMDDALTFMADRFGVDPKEYIAMIDNKNPELMRRYEAYYSSWDRGIHLHKDYSGGKGGSLSPDASAHEITHALNGYLSILETRNHTTYHHREIADEIIAKVFSDNGYAISSRTGLPSKEDVAKAITRYGSTNSLEAIADSTLLVYQRDVLGLNIGRTNDMPDKVFDEMLRRLNDDLSRR